MGVPRTHGMVDLLLGWLFVMCGAAWLMEGWSSVVALQEVITNHRELRWSKAGVVSVTEKACC